ncbi:protein of unknown function [Methanoculleus bourgensis]|uniref:Uncharacterized protein n=1 Tax=Methanoculleus bourgensis TaxID=83986 RepID=A0A0X3BMG9_9EURY|nr:protein of unknown function [Methanoculleus bourgensis]
MERSWGRARGCTHENNLFPKLSHPMLWTAVGIAPGGGGRGGARPSPHKEAMPGAQTEPCSPPLAKSGRFPWEILEEVLR